MWTPALFDEDRTIWLWAGLALFLHLLLGTVLGLNRLKPLPPPQAIKGIAVEIVTSAPVASPPDILPAPEEAAPPVRTDTAAPVPQPSQAPEPPDTQTAHLEAPDRMIRATQLYSAAILNNPKSRKAKARLRQLVSEDRIIQLCNLEALEQVHRWKSSLTPNFLIAYARSDVQLTGRQTIEADGGAFHDRDSWYEIRFKCEISPDLTSVVAFEFAVGRKIPQRKWEEYNLPDRVESVD